MESLLHACNRDPLCARLCNWTLSQEEKRILAGGATPGTSTFTFTHLQLPSRRCLAACTNACPILHKRSACLRPHGAARTAPLYVLRYVLRYPTQCVMLGDRWAGAMLPVTLTLTQTRSGGHGAPGHSDPDSDSVGRARCADDGITCMHVRHAHAPFPSKTPPLSYMACLNTSQHQLSERPSRVRQHLHGPQLGLAALPLPPRPRHKRLRFRLTGNGPAKGMPANAKQAWYAALSLQFQSRESNFAAPPLQPAGWRPLSSLDTCMLCSGGLQHNPSKRHCDTNVTTAGLCLAHSIQVTPA
eukprot:363577-Chlamydomonas_euryale.AAC.6